MFVVHKQSSGLSKIHLAFSLKGQAVYSSLRFLMHFKLLTPALVFHPHTVI